MSTRHLLTSWSHSFRSSFIVIAILHDETDQLNQTCAHPDFAEGQKALPCKAQHFMTESEAAEQDTCAAASRGLDCWQFALVSGRGSNINDVAIL